MHLSFCGCGFLGVYHVGVLSALLRHGPRFLEHVQHVAGASAGALAAALAVTSPTLKDVQTAKENTMSVATKIRRKPLGALTPGYQVADDLHALLEHMLPENAHELANGRLHVSLTDLRTFRNEVVWRFGSRQELLEVLVASCHIPVWTGTKFPVLHGKSYCDGGLTNNLIRFRHGRTVTVSPFSGQQDISPKDAPGLGFEPVYINLRNQSVQMNFGNIERFRHAFFPPPLNVLQQYFQTGEKDAGKFLVREGFYESSV